MVMMFITAIETTKTFVYNTHQHNNGVILTAMLYSTFSLLDGDLPNPCPNVLEEYQSSELS